MTSLKYSTPKRRQYKELCKSKGIKLYAPILDVSTRWNSTYAMLFRALQMREVTLNLMHQ